MKLVIRGHQLGVPRDARTFLRSHVLNPLARLHDSPATELTVSFDDARPQKGGIDQHCRLTLRMPNTRTLTVECVADDIHAALLDCGRRMKRLVERELGKMRSGSRSPMRKPLGRAWREKSTRDGVTPDGSMPATL